MRDKARHHMLEWLSPADWAVRFDSPDVSELDVLSRVLYARGLDTPERQEAFLNVSELDIPDPFLFLDMKKACEIIAAVMQFDTPKVLIFGDYDADGLTSTALLARWFKARGVNPDLLIPDRFDDGYGLSVELAEEISLHRPDLVITVDTGTSSPEAIDRLLSQGIDVVITDHHLPYEGFVRDRVPVINPAISDETYPFKDLSGSGVAYLLTVAMDRFLGVISTIRPTLTVIASIGTVADVMPLVDVNRAIVRAGISSFEEYAPAGLIALQERTIGRDDEGISARDIAFAVAPRLNAAGRMGDVRLALDLLLEDDRTRVSLIADKLDELNEARRKVESDVFSEAFHDVMNRQGDTPLTVAVARGKDWHGGVLGIVSSRLAERLRVPAITLSEEDGLLTGSARTFGNINLIEGIAQAGQYLETYGGHMGAAGLSLRPENFERFRESIIQFIESIPKRKRLVPFQADTTLSGDDIDPPLVESFEALEPTGSGFGRPLFLIPNMILEGIHRVGDGRHLRLKLRSQGIYKRPFDAILFHRGDDEPFYAVGDEIDLMATPDFNIWRDRRTIQLRTKDIRPSCQTSIDNNIQHVLKDVLRRLSDENLSPILEAYGVTSIESNVFIALWQLISALAGAENHPITFLPSRLAWLLTHRYNIDVSALGILLALAIFAEVELGEFAEDEEGGYVFHPLDTGGERMKLTRAPLWEKLVMQGVLKP